MGFPRAEAARPRCSGRVQPGAAALMAWSVNESGCRGASNWGIYNCRAIRGSTNRSVHGDGRAIDVGFPGRGNPEGSKLVNRLLPHVGKLGIQRIIWSRRIWDEKAPGGRRYNGAADHYDHVHIELTWAAAYGLNLSTIRAAMRGVTPPKPVVVTNPQPLPEPQSEEDDMGYLRIVQPGNQAHGRIYRTSGMWYEHMTPKMWQHEQFFRAAKAKDVSLEAFLVLVDGLGLHEVKR